MPPVRPLLGTASTAADCRQPCGQLRCPGLQTANLCPTAPPPAGGAARSTLGKQPPSHSPVSCPKYLPPWGPHDL